LKTKSLVALVATFALALPAGVADNAAALSAKTKHEYTAATSNSTPTQQAPSGGGATATATSASGSCPAVIPQYIIQRESGGNPNARNPSGAYGCYQIMPGTAAAYHCDLSTVKGQADCASRLPMSSWDETR
jgi:hypothetical protein